jgi:phage shock protein PspC (stress-responsive transcriptional regulator)
MNKKLLRPIKGRIVAGVSKGLANYFGVNVLLVRFIWILLLLPGGLPGLLPYLIFWLVIPSENKSLEPRK